MLNVLNVLNVICWDYDASITNGYNIINDDDVIMSDDKHDDDALDFVITSGIENNDLPNDINSSLPFVNNPLLEAPVA